jgi:hypothetical protein
MIVSIGVLAGLLMWLHVCMVRTEVFTHVVVWRWQRCSALGCSRRSQRQGIVLQGKRPLLIDTKVAEAKITGMVVLVVAPTTSLSSQNVTAIHGCHNFVPPAGQLRDKADNLAI